MHDLQKRVLSVFASNSTHSYTTTSLVQHVFQKEYARIEQDLGSADTQVLRAAKREKARLHRKLLHHINVLIQRSALRVDYTYAKGERSYVLAMSSGEMIVHDKTQSVTIVRQHQETAYIHSWIEKGLIRDPSLALHKIEAYVIDAHAYPKIEQLKEDIGRVLVHISDALGIIHVHTLLQHTPEDIQSLLSYLETASQETAITITLHLDLSKTHMLLEQLWFFEQFAAKKHLQIIFFAHQEDILKQQSSLETIAELFGTYKKHFTVQHARIKAQPILLGKAGTYALPVHYEETLHHTRGCIVGAASLCIDLHTHPIAAKDFLQICADAAKTLLVRSHNQRQEMLHLLHGLSYLGPLNVQATTLKNHIRIWAADQETFTHDLLAETIARIRRFAHLESRMFAIAGMPLHFMAVFASAFSGYAQNLSPRNYVKQPMQSRTDLRHDKMAEREQRSRVYDSDRIRIFREGTWHGSDVLSEILHIITHYDIALLTYDFAGIQQRITLTDYMQ